MCDSVNTENMFTNIIYCVFGFQFIIAGCLFLRNWLKLKNIRLYKEITTKINWLWYLVPLIICTISCMILAIFTRYTYSPIVLSTVLLPLLYIHLVCDPLVLRGCVGIKEMRENSFRDIIVHGIRSRFLLLLAVANFILMYYTFLNIR